MTDPRIAEIQQAVADEFGLTLRELCSDRRAAHIVRPRQVAMFLAKKLTRQSLPAIGREFGNRDHTTVLHGCHRVEQRMADDAVLAVTVSALEAILTDRLKDLPPPIEQAIDEVVEEWRVAAIRAARRDPVGFAKRMLKATVG